MGLAHPAFSAHFLEKLLKFWNNCGKIRCQFMRKENIRSFEIYEAWYRNPMPRFHISMTPYFFS